MADDVQLTDLEVISRFSLAVRSATASREEIVEALEADLAWLGGGRDGAAAGSAAPQSSSSPPARTGTRTPRAASRTPAKRTPRRTGGV